jgi:hypothetical protein
VISVCLAIFNFLYQCLKSRWQSLTSSNGISTQQQLQLQQLQQSQPPQQQSKSGGERAEVVEETMLRELLREFASLLYGMIVNEKKQQQQQPSTNADVEVNMLVEKGMFLFFSFPLFLTFLFLQLDAAPSTSSTNSLTELAQQLIVTQEEWVVSVCYNLLLFISLPDSFAQAKSLSTWLVLAPQLALKSEPKKKKN